MKRYKARRQGVYVSPLLCVMIVALCAACLVLGAMRVVAGQNAPADDASAGSSDAADAVAVSGGESGGADESGEDLTHVTTASGIACTLTDVGEDAIYKGDLILVNNWTPYHFPEDQDLVSIYEEKTNSYYVRDMEVYLSPVALSALNTMLDDFCAQGGSKSVNVVAGYRTEEYQQHLFDQSAERNGLEHAQKYVAQPGGSEHHTALVVDLSVLKNGSSMDYDGSGEYAWINENCQNYGFVVRYAQDKAELTGIYDEPWHFRYVGIPHATEMAEQDLCLEEYIDYLKQFPFDGEHLTIECVDGTYEVWYTQGSQVYLPDSGDYALSGNNVDGVVVTYKVSE